jgi:hypothetical protein
MNNGGEELSEPAKIFVNYISFICRVLDKANETGINYIGTMFNLNVNGKKITEQDPKELLNGLTILSNKLSDPKVRRALDIAIDNLEPFLKKSATRFVNIFLEAFKTGLISSVAIACEVPPLSILCGSSKTVSAFLDLAAKTMEIANGSLDDFKDAKGQFTQLSNSLNMPSIPQIPRMPTSPVNMSGLKPPIKIQRGGGSYIQMGGKTIHNLSSIQSAGSKIEKRVVSSIDQFINPLKYYKKTTGKNKKRRNYGTKKYKRYKR